MMEFLFLGLVIGWFASFAYHYSQDGVDETARGAWAVGFMLIIIMIIFGLYTGAHDGTFRDVTPTPTPLGR